MRWLNPAALWGLLALGVPIVVHLFGRRVARRQRFPSLRLLRNVRQTPATRSQPSDVLLLLLRCAVVASAAIALVQPLWSTAERDATARIPVRIILVDTSGSMLRATGGDSTAVQRARVLARSMLDSSRAGIVVETDAPGRDVAGAASWLERRSGLRELVIISDFQSGTVVDGDFALVAEGIGLRTVRMKFSAPDSVARLHAGVRTSLLPQRTEATWTLAVSDAALPVAVLAGVDEQREVRAMDDVVRSMAPRWPAQGRRVALVFPRYPGWSALAERIAPFDSGWQGDLLLALRRDDGLASMTETAETTPGCRLPGAIVARRATGEPVASIARAPSGSVADVAIFSCAEPGSAAATAIYASAVFALAPPVSVRELEPRTVPDEELRRWERPPTTTGPRQPDETSPHGRWLWLLAALLLLVEEWVRRRTPRRLAPVETEVSHERVA